MLESSARETHGRVMPCVLWIVKENEFATEIVFLTLVIVKVCCLFGIHLWTIVSQHKMPLVRLFDYHPSQ